MSWLVGSRYSEYRPSMRSSRLDWVGSRFISLKVSIRIAAELRFASVKGGERELFFFAKEARARSLIEHALASESVSGASSAKVGDVMPMEMTSAAVNLRINARPLPELVSTDLFCNRVDRNCNQR